ncbi:hypothetical protein [Streptomyces sp. Z26]|uniref:hypothetical protein n=1 Tax=Streptomyces sp. Z26 TaxID=2500177 RepID=UPI000EF1397C|nr:hypothetical protein [Streptomyces sp. Z26]RLL66132.1 hypothetical protein D7M15_03635 [Streptomyces sp. Z26]
MTPPRTPGAGGTSGGIPPAPSPASAARRRPRARLRADCTADSAGGLTFDVALRDGSAGDRWDAALLLERRGPGGDGPPYGDGDPYDLGDGPADPFAPGEVTDAADHWVRLPLFPSGDDRLRAALPSTMTLAEGRWDAYVALGEETPRRLLPGALELRPLGDRDPSAHRTWLGVRIPYASRNGGLAVRAWLRWPHAELADLSVADGGLRLRGRLFGAALDDGARVEAWPRGGAGERVTAGVRGAGGPDFTATLCLDTLLATVPGSGGEDRAGPAVRDVWLRPAEGAAPVRVGRILDDVPDKKRTCPHPPHRTADGTATPYYTRDNDLAVRLERPPV